jgi:predicted NAD/FAD-binding protein
MKANKVAVVGSGIWGLSAAWLLARKLDVTLFEAQDRLGGHTHTVDVSMDGMTAPVDTGFLVFNDRTYPNLVGLFRHLGVADAPSDMSFSVRIDEDGVEWAGTSLAALLAQKANLVRLRPRRNRFVYRVFFLRVRTDAIDALRGPLFSVDRWNLFGLHRRDHNARDGSELEPGSAGRWRGKAWTA